MMFEYLLLHFGTLSYVAQMSFPLRIFTHPPHLLFIAGNYHIYSNAR